MSSYFTHAPAERFPFNWGDLQLWHVRCILSIPVNYAKFHIDRSKLVGSVMDQISRVFKENRSCPDKDCAKYSNIPSSSALARTQIDKRLTFKSS